MRQRKYGVMDYDTDNYEYFSNVEMIDPRPTTIKAYVPKYMPKMTGGPWQSVYPINQGILANASDCRPNLPRAVYSHGYITIPKYPLEQPDFMSKAVEVSRGVWKVLPGNTFLAEILHDDIETIKFTGKV